MQWKVATLVLIVALAAPAVRAQPVTLDIVFKLTDLEYKPLAGTPVRLAFTTEKGWQNASAGRRFVTDARGEARLRVPVPLESDRKKRPNNFVSSLLSAPEPAEHLGIAAEMEYAGFHWLYVTDIYRFKDGDVLQDGFEIYSRDAKGHFTVKAKHDEGGWTMPELGGLVLTDPGYQAWNFTLKPVDEAKKLWSLEVAFKRSPAPVRR